jgi:hypothetical protein
VVSITSKACRAAEWSYEVVGQLVPATRGKTVVWTMAPGPPWFVHVDISASLDPLSKAFAWPHEEHAEHATDALLDPKRTRAISLGWVQWSGVRGQLVVAPPYNHGGGEVGDHLMFLFRTDGVSYAITLHAWTSTFRFTANGVAEAVILHREPSLPQVVATLKSVVGSTRA